MNVRCLFKEVISIASFEYLKDVHHQCLNLTVVNQKEKDHPMPQQKVY